jgi:hypothetical protein
VDRVYGRQWYPGPIYPTIIIFTFKKSGFIVLGIEIILMNEGLENLIPANNK